MTVGKLQFTAPNFVTHERLRSVGLSPDVSTPISISCFFSVLLKFIFMRAEKQQLRRPKYNYDLMRGAVG